MRANTSPARDDALRQATSDEAAARIVRPCAVHRGWRGGHQQTGRAESGEQNGPSPTIRSFSRSTRNSTQTSIPHSPSAGRDDSVCGRGHFVSPSPLHLRTFPSAMSCFRLPMILCLIVSSDIHTRRPTFISHARYSNGTGEATPRLWPCMLGIGKTCGHEKMQ